MTRRVGTLGIVAGIAVIGCHHQRGAAAAAEIAATPGPPEVADGFAQPLPHGSFDDYEAAAAEHGAIAVGRAATRSRDATYGYGLHLDGKQPSWAIDRTPAGHVFVFDANANGTLDDDPVHPFELAEASAWQVTIVNHARSRQPVFRIRLDGGQLTVEPITVRWGTISIDGAAIAFGVFGVWGEYRGGVAFDANGDRRVELADHAEYTPGGRIVELHGACFGATVAPAGDRLRLTRRARAFGGGCLEPDDAI